LRLFFYLFSKYPNISFLSSLLACVFPRRGADFQRLHYIREYSLGCSMNSTVIWLNVDFLRKREQEMCCLL
jgi:hypothetical protein